ncbi:MAG: hypothetical protein ABFC24_05290 [Methanoregulaceae archaeon]
MTGTMKIRDALILAIRDSAPSGTCDPAEFAAGASRENFSGIAVAKGRESEDYLLVVRGIPAGALRFNEEGERYGDTAVLLFDPNGRFTLYPLEPDDVEGHAMRCRIYRPEVLNKGAPHDLPEFGKKAAGMGTLTIGIRSAGAPVRGVRVSIRKSGKIVGSDVTLGNGEVSFRIGYGEYDCVVQPSGQEPRTVRISFLAGSPNRILEIFL